MSFILDALKRSEQERERQQAPNVMDIPYGRQPRSKPWWLWVVIGLLLLNCGLLLVMWLRKETPAAITTNAVSSSSSSVSSTAPNVAAPVVTARTTEVRALEDEATNATDPEDTTSTLLSEAATPEGAPLVRAAPLTATEHGINNYPSNSTQSGLTPTLASVGGSAALNLPDLRLDLHVYSSKKAERFAFINSKKYAEGQALSEGPLVEQITNDGVVLSYRGQRFLLPRQ
jgi:general secretion pathway protein B